jgi:autoinducer 2-degrading protein
MYALFVRIRVIAGHADAFLALTRANHLGARTEPGNLRFDVLRDAVDPLRFYLYEVYHDEAAFRAHQQTVHYLAWKEAVAPLMAEPRQAERMHSALPEPWT